MTLVRKIYPEEIWEHIREQIETVLGDSLGLALCDTGNEMTFTEEAPFENLPAVMVDLVEDTTEIADRKGEVDTEYIFEIHYLKAIGDNDRPKKGLIAPCRALREFFLRDQYELPMLSTPGHEIYTAFPGRCVYGEPHIFLEPDKCFEQGSFRLLVRARSVPQQL